MADQSDGSIRINTKIDISDAKKQLGEIEDLADGFGESFQKTVDAEKQVEKALQSIKASMLQVGRNASKAMSGTNSSIESFEYSVTKAESALEDLEKHMNELASAEVPTDEYKKLAKEVELAGNHLRKTLDIHEKYMEAGTKPNSKTSKLQLIDIDTAQKQLETLEKQLQALYDSGGDKKTILNSEQFSEVSNAIKAAREQISTYHKEVSDASFEKTLSDAINEINSTIRNVGTNAQKVMSSSKTSTADFGMSVQEAKTKLDALDESLKQLDTQGDEGRGRDLSFVADGIKQAKAWIDQFKASVESSDYTKIANDAISQISASLEKVGTSASKAMSGSESQIDSFVAAAEKAKEKISELESQFNEMEKARTPEGGESTEQYKQVSSAIQAAREQIEAYHKAVSNASFEKALNDAINEINSTVHKAGSDAQKVMSSSKTSTSAFGASIEEARAKLDALSESLKHLDTQGDEGNAEYLKYVTDGIKNAKQSLDQFKANVENSDYTKIANGIIDQISASLDKVEKSARRAMDGSSSSVNRFNETVLEAEKKINELDGKIRGIEANKVSETGVSSEQYKLTVEAVDKALEAIKQYKEEVSDASYTKAANDAVSKISASLEKVDVSASRAMGGSKSQIESFISASKKAEETISELEAKINEMESARVPEGGENTEQYKLVSDAIREAREQLAEYDLEVSKSNKATVFERTKSAISSLADAITSAKDRVVNFSDALKSGLKRAVTKASSMIDKLKKSISGSEKTAKSSIKTMLKYGLSIRSLYVLVRKLKSVVEESFESLAQWDDEVNSSLSQMLTSLNTVKAQLAPAFAPIVNYVAPYITILLDYLNEAIKVISQFFAALSGSSTYTVATSDLQDYAESVSDTADATSDATDAAEEAERQLAGFDELNVLSDSSSDSSDSDSSGSSGSSGITYSTEDISTGISDYVAALKEAWANGDWESVGAQIASSINSAFAYAQELISWDNVGETITYYVEAITGIFNSLVDNIDWNLIGETFGTGINTIVYTINELYDGIDWENLGTSIAEGLNGMVSTVDASAAGSALAKKFTSVITTASAALLEFDFEALGTQVGTGFNSFVSELSSAIKKTDFSGIASNVVSGVNAAIKTIDWSNLGTLVSDGIVGALEFVVTSIQTFDWSAAASAFADFVSAIDFSEIASLIFEGLGSALGGIAAFFAELINEAFQNIADYFDESIEDAGGNILLGILQGIVNGILDIGTWIKNNILEPFIEGFCDAFGISSPASEMLEYGGYILEGILQGIVDAIAGIGTWVQNNILGPIADAIGGAVIAVGVALECATEWAADAWAAIQSAGQTLVTTVKSALKKATTWASEAWTVLQTAAETVTRTLKQALAKAGSFASDVLTVMKKTAETIQRTLKQGLAKLGSFASDVLTVMKKTAETVQRTLKQGLAKLGSFASDVLSVAKKTAETIKRTLKQGLSKAGTYAANAVTAMKAAAETITRTLKQKLSKAGTYAANAVTAMKKAAGNVVSTLKQKLSKSGTYNSDAMTVVSRKAGEIVSTLKQKLKKATGSSWSSDALDVIQNAADKTITVTLSIVSKVASALKSLLGLETGGVIVHGVVHQFAGGGSVKDSWWDSVQKYSSGTSSAHGTVFVAGESGPEIVGHVNGRTEILNKSQLADAMYAAVVSGIGDALNSFWEALSSRMAECTNTLITNIASIGSISSDDAGIISTIQSIADNVVFSSIPVIASGTVVPYSAAQADEDVQDLINAMDEDNEALISAISTTAASVAAQIVQAIQTYNTREVTMSTQKATTEIVNEINRRTRANGASPILGV